MAYTALELITKSYYLSQIVARGLQTVSGEQITDGLFLLNQLLGFKSSDIRLIPYFRQYDFDTVQGQESYSIPNLVYTDSLTFNLGTVRFSLQENTRDEFFAIPRVDTIQSLPYCYRVERDLAGSTVYLYFVPSQVFQMKLWGKFGFDSVDLTTDLSLTFDTFYLEYLRFALAEYICSDWGNTFPDQSMMKFREIEKKLLDVSPPDLSIRSQSFLSGQPGFDWAMANLYRGFLPG